MFYPGRAVGACVGGACAPRGRRSSTGTQAPARPRRSSCRTRASSIRDRSPPRLTRVLPPGARRSGASCCSARRTACRSAGSRCLRSRRSRRRWASVAVDRAAVDARSTLPPGHRRAMRAHALEHSLEVQLPFLQAVLGDFSIVPFAVGDATPDEVGEVIDLLWGGEETLIVVSSDLVALSPVRRRAQDRSRDRRRDPRAVGHARSRAGLRRDADQRSSRWPRVAAGSRPSSSTCAIRATRRATRRASSVMRRSRSPNRSRPSAARSHAHDRP